MLNPETYQRENSIQRRDTKDVLNDYFHHVNWRPDGNDVILDVGCGLGDVTWELLRPKFPLGYGRLIGIDISESMVRFARKQYPQVEFVQMDVAATEILKNFKGMADHIFSFYCLHWIHDQRQAMKNLYSMLKPGGDMLICYLAKNPIYDVFLNLSKINKWQPYMKDVNKYISPFQFCLDVEENLRRILLEVGFDITICECKKKWYEYENMQVLQKAMNAVNPFYNNLPDNMKDNFTTDYIKELSKLKVIEENNNKFDSVLFPYKIINIFARKPLITNINCQ